MPDIPESAIAAAADAIMTAQNSNDDEPERWESRRLARAALEAAAPLLAQAWGIGKGAVSIDSIRNKDLRVPLEDEEEPHDGA